MTPDWAKLGLREPVRPDAVVAYEWQCKRRMLWLFPSAPDEVLLYPPTQWNLFWSVFNDEHIWHDFPTIEEAAAHLKRLGCGRDA